MMVHDQMEEDWEGTMRGIVTSDSSCSTDSFILCASTFTATSFTANSSPATRKMPDYLRDVLSRGDNAVNDQGKGDKEEEMVFLLEKPTCPVVKAEEDAPEGACPDGVASLP